MLKEKYETYQVNHSLAFRTEAVAPKLRKDGIEWIHTQGVESQQKKPKAQNRDGRGKYLIKKNVQLTHLRTI